MRMGSGAGFSSDRLGPAVDIARDGGLDWLVFETIGERTLAFGHRDRQLDPARGYNPQLAARMRGVLEHCRANGTRIMTNMGVAHVEAAAEVIVTVARELGLEGLKVAAVLGDDVTAQMTPETVLFDYGGRALSEVGRPLVGANAYLGIDAMLPAVESGADVIITGRVADPSLFLAPIVDRFGWAKDDWARLGQGTLVGHLMECGMQITGGYFADPGVKDVPRPADCGYPIAEIDESGTATITKLASAGGMVNTATVKEQMLYEVHDPSRYLTPDVTADFSKVRIDETSKDHVQVTHGGGTERPKQLKVTVGFDGGLLGEAEASYAGINAAARARLARDILVERFDRVPGMAGQLPHRPDRPQRGACDGRRAGGGEPGRARAGGDAVDGPGTGRVGFVGGGGAALLRAGWRRRVSRPDHARRRDAFRDDRPRGGGAVGEDVRSVRSLQVRGD